MNTFNNLKLSSPWAEVKEKIKEANAEISDDDLSFEPGNEEGLISNLAKKMKMNHEDVRGWIESLSANKGKAS
jgi:uncharacterized protein YjbJ (UPF0337 family)